MSIRGMATSQSAVAGWITARLLCEKWIMAMATAQPRKVLPASPIKILFFANGLTVRLNSKNTPMDVVR